MKGAHWGNTNDILKSFTNADVFGNGTRRVVFDIGGNKYRFICGYSFGENFVHLFINWIGTHVEYSKVYDKNNQFTKMANDYTIIRTEGQYFEYCDQLELLVTKKGKKHLDDMELLTLLIEKWDSENLLVVDSNPIELIKALMKQNSLKSVDMAAILEVNKSTVSRILNYQKGLSKSSIRILANHFAISQESLNQPYKLKHEVNKKFKNASLMNTKKKLEVA